MTALRLPSTEGIPLAENHPGSFRAFKIVPGIIAGAADLDPAAVLTATVAGASFGYSLIWVVLLCVPILFSVFSVSSRLGHQTRKGLVDRKSTRLNSSHTVISYAVFCLKKKKKHIE